MKKNSSYGISTTLILLLAAYVFAKFQGGFVSWFLFYSFLPIALYTLLQWITALRGVTVMRKLNKQKLTAGESLDIVIEIHNPYRLPLIYLVIEDHLDTRLLQHTQSNRTIIYPWMKKKITLTYQVNQLPRGVFQWEKTTLRTGDLFGFVQKEIAISNHTDVVVYPKYYELRSWRTFNEKNVGQQLTMNRQDEDLSAVMGVRDYVPGDRLASIHWKASARSTSLKTKEFEHQVTNDFMFFMDRQELSYAGKNSEVFEQVVSLTATLFRYAIKHHFSSGLVSYGNEATILSMSRDQEHLYRVFEHLARIQPDTTLSFVQTLLREVSYLPIGTTVVILTPRIHHKLILAIGELTYRKIKVELFAITSQEMNEEEKQSLALLDQLQVAYHIVRGDRLGSVLGGERHISAS